VTGGRAAEHLSRFLGRRRLPLLLLFSIVLVVPVAIQAKAKPFWHDEIYTVLLARLPSASLHWAAVRDGADLAPPLNAFATRAVFAVAGVGPVSARVPALVGFSIMTLVVFALVFERSNATLAFAGVCIPLFTAAYRYSFEARPYGLMMGLAALAWLAWSEAAAGRRRRLYLAILGLALALGLWNHYFAVLVYLPIAAGELVRATRERRVDGVLWAIVAGSLLAAVPLYPLIALSVNQAASFWSRPAAADIPVTYSFLFATLLERPLIWASAAIAVLVIAAQRQPPAAASSARAIPPHEVAAALACLLLPALGVLLALLATGAFVPRYGMSAVAGVSITIPLIVGRFARRAPVAEIVLLAALAGTYVTSLPRLLRVAPFQDPVAARPLLLNALQSPGPTIGSGGLWYLQLWYYAPTPLKPHFIYLADPASALQYRGSDVIDRGYIALSHWVPLPVEPFDAFVMRRKDFRIYGAGDGWLLERLRAEHAVVDMVGTEAGGQLYDASLASAHPSRD
jgi:hypothetical protein